MERRNFIEKVIAGAAAGAATTGVTQLLVGCSSPQEPARDASKIEAPSPSPKPSLTAVRPAPNPRLFTFVGGDQGAWKINRIQAIVGDGLVMVTHLDVVAGALPGPAPSNGWLLRGVTSNERYVTRPEKDQLVAKQAALGRPEATLGALIPIKKSAKWWAMTQDERRAIFEERSKHVTIGLKYLPGVARRLHHCRDLEDDVPFDFVTFFDYAPSDEAGFDAMLKELRATEEWKFVEREVDIRLVRA